MLAVKTPELYINEPGAVSNAGGLIAGIGKKPLLIGGKTALEAVSEQLFSSLKEVGIDTFCTETFTGYPSERQFEKYAKTAQDLGCDVIIGIGGGRVLDTAKAVADILELPAVTVPTIAATCAAWAAVTIQYDDEGAYVKCRWNRHSAKIVIADPEVIFCAPGRYLFSGVADTFAKLYETRPSLEKYPGNITFALAVYGSRLAYDKLSQQTFLALEEAGKGIYGPAAKNVIDAIIYLAGFAGSFQEDGMPHYGFAHPFYHVSTRLANTRKKLHGEKVAFGIVAQMFLEKKPEQEIMDTIRLFEKYHTAFTLEDIGISENRKADIDFMKRDILREFPYVNFSPEEIKDALLAADALTKRIRGTREEEKWD